MTPANLGSFLTECRGHQDYFGEVQDREGQNLVLIFDNHDAVFDICEIARRCGVHYSHINQNSSWLREIGACKSRWRNPHLGGVENGRTYLMIIIKQKQGGS